MPWFGGGIAPPLPNSAPSTRTCVARRGRFDAICGPGASSRPARLTSSWWQAASVRKGASCHCVAGAKATEAPSGPFPSGERNNDEILEGSSAEQRPVVSANADRFVTQAAKDPIQLVDRRLFRDPYQSVGECDQQSARALAVGIGVGSAQVAQGVLDPEGACLEEKPLMRRPPAGGGDSQSDFERHVEARCAAGELNATEIVEGVPAYGNQLQDAVQAPRAARDLERGPRAEPEGAETGNQGNEELLVTRVVGDVEKRVVRRVTLGDRSAPVCYSPPRCGPIPGAAFPAASQGVGDHCHQFQIALAGDAQRSGGCGRGGVGSRKAIASLYAARVFRVNAPGRRRARE